MFLLRVWYKCNFRCFTDSSKNILRINERLYSSSFKGMELYEAAGCDFLGRLHELIQKEKLPRGGDRDGKVLNFKHPAELQELLDLEIPKEGKANSQLLSICTDLIKYSVATCNVMFFNQLYSGVDPYGLAGAWLTEALNTNEHTFEVAPVFIVITDYVIKKLNGLVGYEDGDGVFVPGGSMANIMALAMARYRYNNEIKTKGLFGEKKLVIYSSEMCHYSSEKGAAFLGMGTDSIISVKSDDDGRMCMKNLREKVLESKQQGHVPIAVVATSGTTVLGAYDDLEGIADICQEFSMWLHVDACWGGGVIFSPKHRHLVKGIERSDSLGISLHKMMGAQLQCVPLLVKDKDILKQCFSYGATYLFQQDKFYDTSYDIGDKTVQCGRKADAMKFWFMWQARGEKGMAEHVDKAFHNANYFKEKLEQTEGFRVVRPKFQCTNICFWYIPPSIRGQEETEEWWQKLHLVAPKIKERMQLSGSMLIGYQPLAQKNYVNFFRIIIENPRLTHKDLDHVVEEIDKLGQDL